MYRENIYDVLRMNGEQIDTLIVPKNTGLKGYVWKVLKEAGLDLYEAEQIGEGKLKAKGLTLLLRRGEDIPRIVMDEFRQGRLVMGLTGDDLLDEYKLKDTGNTLRVENTYDWDDEAAMFRRPALCLINKTGELDSFLPGIPIAINAKYESTSRDYLRRSLTAKGINPKINVYNGDLESAVTNGSNECCIDTVYTGKSIKDRGLQIAQTIRYSDLSAITALRSEESFFGKVMKEEMRRLIGRRDSPTDSYTSQLLADPQKAARKLNEEAFELGIAALGRGDVTAEAADVLYSTGLILARNNVSLEELARVMKERQK